MGELDLSIASILAVSGVVMASFDNVALGIVVALAIGLVIGAVNAFFVVVVGINSFIATLGMLFFLRGLAFVISDEEPVVMANKDFALDFGEAADRRVHASGAHLHPGVHRHARLPHPRPRRAGVYAVGGNREAARDAGIPVRRRVFTGFMTRDRRRRRRHHRHPPADRSRSDRGGERGAHQFRGRDRRWDPPHRWSGLGRSERCSAPRCSPSCRSE